MKKNNLVISLLVLLIISLNMVSVTSSSARIYVDPPNIVNPGQTFDVNVKVSDVTNLYSYDFKLKYDTNLLDVDSINVGTFTEIKKDINDADGYVWVASTLLRPAAPKSGSVTLATIRFRFLNRGQCVLDLYDIMLAELVDNTVGVINHYVNDGYFSDTVTCRGDITGDNKVDIDDITLVALAFGSYCYENTCPSGYSCWDDYALCNHKSSWNPIGDIIRSGGGDGLNVIDIDDVVYVALLFGYYC